MIEMHDVGFGYAREPLFQGLHLELARGRLYGLLGVNGAGKSTLLRLASGLLYAQQGCIRCLGRDPARREPRFLGDVFMLPEQLNLPTVTVGEYLAVRAPFYPKFDRELFERYRDELELPRARTLPALSHGQQKKLLLAFGLASGASLLLLDEPTNGLDIPSKGLFRRLVAEALTEDRLVVISTHQVRDVTSLIDSIVVLHHGRVLLCRLLTEIAARLRISKTATQPAAGTPELLHVESGVGGFWSVWREDGADEQQLDLEVLFNALISRPEISGAIWRDAPAHRSAAAEQAWSPRVVP